MSSPASDQMVTASDLVRHFGVWQDRAARAPVYVMHRGRPRLVMTSIDLMDALCASHAPNQAETDVQALLDHVREAVIITDRDRRVTALSRAATAMLGTGAAPGATIARAWPSAHDFVDEAARRVAESGIAESIEIPSPRDAEHRHLVVIEPLAAGIGLFGRDITNDVRLADEVARGAALDRAIAALGGIAPVQINPRGFVEHPGAALAALTALDLDALSSARFASLFEIGSRVAVGDALEAVMRGATPGALRATLLVNRSTPIPVRIALAPVLRNAAIEAVAGLIISSV